MHTSGPVPSRQLYELVTAEVGALEVSGLLDERPDLAHRAVMRMLAVASNPALILSSDHQLNWTGERDVHCRPSEPSRNCATS